MGRIKQRRRIADAIVDEVRTVREAIDAEVGHDVAKLAQRAAKVGEEYRRKLGCRRPRLPEQVVSLPPSG
jgi:hypothetical protein